ncbi:MAG TPA: chorismate pyruvate-lyase family protein [Glaciihabitans sp.]|jgi:chorismate-pyruvate lyase|nr:chorismate pyruvate-lyase family protein [Glaciihabitans sp.]
MTKMVAAGRPRRPIPGRSPVIERGATDEFPGLGRVEQLVLRGDGLTTTSLEILTGDTITVRVNGHWSITVPGRTDPAFTSAMFTDDAPDVSEYLATAHARLEAQPGEVLLVRDVLLVGSSGRVHGSAEVIARHTALPAKVADALASTDQPIGRLLRDHAVGVTRELRTWGFMPAGPQARHLSPELTSLSRVLGRTYVMRLTSTGTPLAVLTERFASHVFTPAR